MQKSLKFIGIDISKSTLDICALGKDSSVHYQIENQALQIRKFFRTFTKTLLVSVLKTQANMDGYL
jgi:hypothetical protein